MTVQNNQALKDRGNDFQDTIDESDPLNGMINNHLNYLEDWEKAALKLLLLKVENQDLQEEIIEQLIPYSRIHGLDLLPPLFLIIKGVAIADSPVELTRTYLKCLIQKCFQVVDSESDADKQFEKITAYSQHWKESSKVFFHSRVENEKRNWWLQV